MEFLFSCSIRYHIRSLRSLVRYRVEHSKRNSISLRAHVLLSTSARHARIMGQTQTRHTGDACVSILASKWYPKNMARSNLVGRETVILHWIITPVNFEAT